MSERLGTAVDAASHTQGVAATAARGSFLLVGVVMLGNLASVNTVLTYTMGVFIGTLHQDLGWSRAQISLSMTWYTIVAFLGTALIGKVADRFNPGRLAAVSMLAFGVALFLVPRFVHDIGSFWIAYFVLAVVGLGTSPVVLTKPVIAAFTKRRGLAIGVSLSGAGIGGFVAPRLAATLIERGSWQLAYVGLGCLAIAVAPILWFGLGFRTTSASTSATPLVPVIPGATFREAFRLRQFLILSGVALFGGLGLSGPAAHLIPYLRDHAITPVAAASFASVLGLASIAGRVVTGYTLDRTNGPAVGLPLLLAGSLGITLLLLLDVHAAAAGIFLLGFAIGSEIDLLAYFTSRYFGLRAHATIFGWNYGMVAFGAATVPVFVGAMRDHQGNYAASFTLSAAALALAGLCCVLLGAYRYPLPTRATA